MSDVAADALTVRNVMEWAGGHETYDAYAALDRLAALAAQAEKQAQCGDDTAQLISILARAEEALQTHNVPRIRQSFAESLRELNDRLDAAEARAVAAEKERDGLRELSDHDNERISRYLKELYEARAVAAEKERDALLEAARPEHDPDRCSGNYRRIMLERDEARAQVAALVKAASSYRKHTLAFDGQGTSDLSVGRWLDRLLAEYEELQ